MAEEINVSEWSQSELELTCKIKVLSFKAAYLIVIRHYKCYPEC